MASLLQTNLPGIMKTVENQLFSFIPQATNQPITGSIQNIYWVFQNNLPPPGQTGERDILLIEMPDKTVNIQGDARFAMVYSGIRVCLRTTYIVDKHGTYKQWMLAHATIKDTIQDALMGFFPVDQNSNAYTVEGFVLDDTPDPAWLMDSPTWGESIGAYRFHYLPNVNTSLLTT